MQTEDYKKEKRARQFNAWIVTMLVLLLPMLGFMGVSFFFMVIAMVDDTSITGVLFLMLMSPLVAIATLYYAIKVIHVKSTIKTFATLLIALIVLIFVSTSGRDD